jgi:hypothetical protein
VERREAVELDCAACMAGPAAMREGKRGGRGEGGGEAEAPGPAGVGQSGFQLSGSPGSAAFGQRRGEAARVGLSNTLESGIQNGGAEGSVGEELIALE